MEFGGQRVPATATGDGVPVAGSRPTDTDAIPHRTTYTGSLAGPLDQNGSPMHLPDRTRLPARDRGPDLSALDDSALAELLRARATDGPGIEQEDCTAAGSGTSWRVVADGRPHAVINRASGHWLGITHWADPADAGETLTQSRNYYNSLSFRWLVQSTARTPDTGPLTADPPLTPGR
ncbi:hypothetical protein ACWGB8_06060 [Kitasatospora sp. NPDC054939]